MKKLFFCLFIMVYVYGFSEMVGLSLGERQFIQGGIAQDLRSDGRKRLTYRPIGVETGVIPQVECIMNYRYAALRFYTLLLRPLFLVSWLSNPNFSRQSSRQVVLRGSGWGPPRLSPVSRYVSLWY